MSSTFRHKEVKKLIINCCVSNIQNAKRLRVLEVEQKLLLKKVYDKTTTTEQEHQKVRGRISLKNNWRGTVHSKYRIKKL